MGCWELKRSIAISVPVSTGYGHRSLSNYGNRYKYTPTKPETQQTFTGSGFLYDDLAPYRAAALVPWDQPGSTVNLVDRENRGWSGKIANFKADPYKEGSTWWTASITLDNPVRL